MDEQLHRPALEQLRRLLRTSTTSMTSVPKPLKFLRPHFEQLIRLHDDLQTRSVNDTTNRCLLADILSVVAMSTGDPSKRMSLHYRLNGSMEPLESWGHEYVRHLAAEIAQEYEIRVENEQSYDDILTLAQDMVPFFMQHHAEADACDLLTELFCLDKIIDYIDEETYYRVCLYLESMSMYVAYPENIEMLHVIYRIYRKLNKWSEAMLTAIRMNRSEAILETFDSCSDATMRRQLAYIMAREHISVVSSRGQTDTTLVEILSNTFLSKHFLALARELEILEPKTAEDVFKSHLENVKFPGPPMDPYKQNMLTTLVNGFVNAGFGRDKLMLNESPSGTEAKGNGSGTSASGGGETWLYKNRDLGMLCAVASVGMLLQWDIDMVSRIDKYLYANDDYIIAGGLMAVGIMSCGVRSEYDPALYLLSEYTTSKTPVLLISSVVGLGLAYIQTSRQEIIDLLLRTLSSTSGSPELHALTALSLGLVCLGTGHGDVTSAILQAMMECDEKTLSDPYMRFMTLGLAFVYLERRNDCEVVLESLKVVGAPLGKQASVLVEVCAHVGSGEVTLIQKLLHLCLDHLDKTKEDDLFQTFAVLGLALVALREEIGSEMATRLLHHLMHYGEPAIRKAVPLALGLLYVSNPQHLSVLDALSKYSHDSDTEVTQSAIFAMGLVGAGTNNARLAQILRQLASYYNRDSTNLYTTRLAQGLLHMGKGMLTLNPWHAHRTIMSKSTLVGLLVSTMAFTDSKYCKWILYLI